jgi:hypothetical protein
VGGTAAGYKHPVIMVGESASERVDPPDRVSLLIGPYSVNAGRWY